MKKLTNALLISTALISTQAMSSSFSYNYLDLKVGEIEYDDSDVEGDHTRFTGSYEIEGRVFATLEISSNEYDDSDTEYDYLKYGVGMHTSMGSTADLYGTFRVVEQDVDGSEDIGNQIDLGIRIAVSKSLELNGKLMRLKFDEEPYNGYTTAARFYLNPNVAVGGGIEFWDRDGTEFEVMYVNARFNF